MIRTMPASYNSSSPFCFVTSVKAAERSQRRNLEQPRSDPCLKAVDAPRATLILVVFAAGKRATNIAQRQPHTSTYTPTARTQYIQQ